MSSASAPNRFVAAIDRWVRFVLRHWLSLLTLLFFVYITLPLLAPVLMRAGAELPARIIYTIYIPFCHQLPERSYFLFGEAPVYSLEELQAAGVATGGLLERRFYNGDHEHGYKAALCERDLAIYGSMFVLGAFLLVRKRRPPRLKPLWYVLFFVLPIAVDGLSQLAGFRESNWALRTLTGALFGIGTLWFVYPYLADALNPEYEG